MKNLDNVEMSIEELYQIMGNSRFTIFGTGTVAKRLCYMLRKRGFWNNLNGFATSQNHGSEFEGKKVMQIGEISKDDILLIAVHKVVYDEVKILLQQYGITKYYWIYPQLFDLYFGKPIQKDIIVDVRTLIRNLYGVYSHAIFYLAIAYYFHQNDFGKQYYIKYMNIFSNSQTSKARWKDFLLRIEECEKNGFLQDFNIKLNSSQNIILDGAHRVMLAYYFGKDMIRGDIYRCEMRDYLRFSGNIALTEDKLHRFFTNEEMEIIKETDEMLKGKNI